MFMHRGTANTATDFISGCPLSKRCDLLTYDTDCTIKTEVTRFLQEVRKRAQNDIL